MVWLKAWPDIMMKSAVPCEPLRGLRLRSRAKRPSSRAMRGVTSVNRTPGTAVPMVENSPRTLAAASGLGS